MQSLEIREGSATFTAYIAGVTSTTVRIGWFRTPSGSECPGMAFSRRTGRCVNFAREGLELADLSAAEAAISRWIAESTG